jgi:CheY-like chemotaxis protein
MIAVIVDEVTRRRCLEPFFTTKGDRGSGLGLVQKFPRPTRILLIDDDPVLLASPSEALVHDGHRVEAANGGRQGIEVFLDALKAGNPFPVVITDLGMPYVDGRAVAAAIKAAAPPTFIIMLTGWGQRLVASGEIPTEVVAVLSKPPKLAELRQVLADCTGEPAEKVSP